MDTIHDITQHDFERFENYIRNTFSKYERINFEKELSNNPPLRAKFDEIKLIIEGIEQAELKDTLEQIHRDLNLENKSLNKQSFLNKKFITVAASSIGIILLISALFLIRPAKNEQLFAGYFKSDPGLVTAMSTHS